MSNYPLKELVPVASNLVVQHFGLEEFDVDLKNDIMSSFRLKLKKVIDYLLDKDFEKLIHILYRIDIEEEKVKYALSGVDDKTPSDLITEFVIERELAKAETRLRYR